jgi:hypothetical protein
MGNRNGIDSNSLLFCLDELKKLEHERIDAEQRARTERERAEADRLAAAAAAEEHRARVAAEEARLRVAADIAARDAEAERRLASLRNELTAVQTEREVLRARFVDVATELPSAAAEDRRRAARGWGIAFGVASAVAAGLAVMLVYQDPTPPVVAPAVEMPIASTQVTTVEPPAAPVAPVAAPVVAEPAPAPVAVASPRPPRPVRPVRPVRPRPDILSNIDNCGDDLICGLEDEE